VKPSEREELREVVAALEGSCAAASHRATNLAAWRDLIEGRCSLVESFDSGGRRFLIARPNPPGMHLSAALSALEAKALLLRAQSASYKVIADELALSAAAGHNLVQSGMKKLGIRDEAELPALFGRVPAQDLQRER
jgi:DNA-binding CsgD family transcriptional regulator